MPNFTSGPDGQRNLRFGCLSEYPTVRFGHFAELEQVSGNTSNFHGLIWELGNNPARRALPEPRRTVLRLEPPYRYCGERALPATAPAKC